MRIVVIDIEANGLLNTITKLHCAVAMTLDGKEVWKFKPYEMNEFVAFLKTVDVWIGHNIIQYDVPAIKQVLGYEFEGKKVDTLLMSRLQNPHRTAPFHAKNKKEAMKVHGLYAWGVRVGIDKPEIEYWDEYNEEILFRCEEDVRINVATYHALQKEGEGLNWRNAHLLTFKLWENLFKQEQAGWLVDRPYMERCIRLLDKWVGKVDSVLEKHLPIVYDILESKKDGEYGWVKKPFMKSGAYSASVEKHYGISSGCNCRLNAYDSSCDNVQQVAGPFTRINFRPVDLGSPAESKDWMISQGWEPAEWNLDADGNPRSPKMPKDGDFPGVEGKAGKLYAKRAKSAHRRSNIQGWLDRVREDGRLESRVTGLADTRRAKHGNIANVPNAEAWFGKQMRKGFTSRGGWVLVSADAASCQDRMMADRAGDDAFTKMLLEGQKEDGTDSHTLAQFAINPVLSAFKLHQISRGKAKNYNFGWTFGASDNKLGKMAGGSKEAGGEIREALRKVFPAKAALIDKVTEEWQKNAKVRVNRWGKKDYYDGWIRGLDGAPIYIKSGHAVLVYAVQSDEAIYMSAVYNLVHKFLADKYKWGDDYVIVCFYHDEITVECREELGQDIAKILERAFSVASDYFKFKVPQKGEAKIGKNWYEVH